MDISLSVHRCLVCFQMFLFECSSSFLGLDLFRINVGRTTEILKPNVSWILLNETSQNRFCLIKLLRRDWRLVLKTLWDLKPELLFWKVLGLCRWFSFDLSSVVLQDVGEAEVRLPVRWRSGPQEPLFHRVRVSERSPAVGPTFKTRTCGKTWS